MSTGSSEKAPDPSLRDSILAAARVEESPPRAAFQRRQALLLVAALALSLLYFWYRGGVRLGGDVATRPPLLALATAVGAALVTTVVVWLVFVRRRSVLPPGATTLATVLLAAPLVLLAWKIGVSTAVPDMTVEWKERAGYRCFWLSLVLGTLPLLALLLARFRTVPRHAALVGAAFGVAAGACSWTLVDLWCPVAWTPHLLLGHVLPLVLLSVAGAALGAMFLPPRAR